MGLILAIVGLVALLALSNIENSVGLICDTKTEELGNISIGEVLPGQYTQLVDKWMCSPAQSVGVSGCPCTPDAKKTWDA